MWGLARVRALTDAKDAEQKAGENYVNSDCKRNYGRCYQSQYDRHITMCSPIARKHRRPPAQVLPPMRNRTRSDPFSDRAEEVFHESR